MAFVELLKPFLHAGHMRWRSPCAVFSSLSSLNFTGSSDLSEK
jgi:hypothetical protein